MGHADWRSPSISKSCLNDELFDRKAGIQIVECAGSWLWETIQFATPFDAEPICGTPFSDPLSKGAERWCSSSLRSSSHHFSGHRATLGLEMGSPRWCHRIWRELPSCPDIESLFKIVMRHVRELNIFNLVDIPSKSSPFWQLFGILGTVDGAGQWVIFNITTRAILTQHHIHWFYMMGNQIFFHLVSSLCLSLCQNSKY
jgi:hypothetical protein